LGRFREPFQRVRAVELSLVLNGQMPVRQHVLRGVLQQSRGLRKRARRPSATFRSGVIAVA
jgi:hypothetical protein